MVIFAHNENRGFPVPGGHSLSQNNPSEISLRGDERTVFLRKGGIPSTVIITLLCGRLFSLQGEERLSTNSKTQRYSLPAQHDIVWKTCGPVTENVNILVDGRKKTQAIVFTNEELPKTFQSFHFILKELGC